MGGKKKSKKTKGFTIAGEQVFAPRLSVSEDQAFKKIAAIGRIAADVIAEDYPELSGIFSSVNKRGAVAKGTLGFFLQHFKGKHRRLDIVEGMAKAIMLPGPKEEEITSPLCHMLGAAIWLLDYIKNNGLEEDLYALLPEKPDEDIKWNLPVMTDLVHSEDEILGVLALIEHRKGDQRQAFKKLCALVDQETIGSLKKIFRDTLLDYVDRYLEVCTCVTPSRPSILSIHKDGMRLSMTTQSICGPFYLDFSDPSARAKEQPEMCFLFETQALAGKPPEEVRKTLYFRKSSDLLLGFKIPNPYDICAACLSRPWRENPHRRSRSGMNRHMGIE